VHLNSSPFGIFLNSPTFTAPQSNSQRKHCILSCSQLSPVPSQQPSHRAQAIATSALKIGVVSILNVIPSANRQKVTKIFYDRTFDHRS
jgi:hypothetical protein